MAERLRDTSTPIGAGLTLFTSLIPNSWWSWWEPLRYAGIAAGIGLMAWGVAPHLGALFKGQKPERSKIWLFIFAGCALVIPPWTLVIRSFQSSGFNSGWPDAIVCNAIESNKENFGSTSELIFYSRGYAVSRGTFGPVMIYFMPGGEITEQNREHFFAHEIWFRFDKPHLIVIPPLEPSNDLLIANYQKNFPAVDCGTGFRDHGLENLTVGAVKKKYVFARPQ